MYSKYDRDSEGLGLLLCLLLLPFALSGKNESASFHWVVCGLLGLAAVGALTLLGGGGYLVYRWYFG